VALEAAAGKVVGQVYLEEGQWVLAGGVWHPVASWRGREPPVLQAGLVGEEAFVSPLALLKAFSPAAQGAPLLTQLLQDRQELKEGVPQRQDGRIHHRIENRAGSPRRNWRILMQGPGDFSLATLDDHIPHKTWRSLLMVCCSLYSSFFLSSG
jgi:hypothetical protein